MSSIIDRLRLKVRALVNDIPKLGTEPFEYTVSNVFTLQEPYIYNIISVTKNGVELGSGDYSFDENTNEVTVTETLTSGDIIIVKYNYYKYSNVELSEYIRASLVWISLHSFSETDFEMEDDDYDIYPVPTNKQEDLIALIASILIKPLYSEYRLPNSTVRYPETMSKEEKINKLIDRFQRGLGISDVIEIDYE